MFEVLWTIIRKLFFSPQGSGDISKKADSSVKENVDDANKAGERPSGKPSADPMEDLISGLGTMQIK